MSLHPQAQAIVDAANAAGVPFEATDYHAMRVAYNATTASYRHSSPPLDSVANLMIAGPQSNLRIRVYRPRAGTEGALPVIVFCHGGGWVVGDLDSHDHLCRYLVGHSGAALVSVDYRLAPEHKFPAAFDDALAAVRWASRRADDMAFDASRIAVAGDSAGGNLAAAVALALRGEIDLIQQVLLYPAVDCTADNASLRDNANGYLLSTAAMKQFFDWYLPSADCRTDWRASPQLADNHDGCAPAFIATAGFDPLRDEAVDYADTLRAAGVDVEYIHYPDMIHGFARMGGRIDAGVQVLDRAAARLRTAFNT